MINLILVKKNTKIYKNYYSSSLDVRPEKFQFLEKGQNRNFGYKFVISVKNPEFIF